MNESSEEEPTQESFTSLGEESNSSPTCKHYGNGDNDGNDNKPSSKQIKKEISKKYFPVGKKISDDHIRSIFGEVAIDATSKELETWHDVIQQDRQDVKSWGTMEIKKRMITTAKSIGIEINSFQGLQSAWSDDGSDEMSAKIWYVAYGDFDAETAWECHLEQKYMVDNGWGYHPGSAGTNPKGCVASQLAHIKNDLVKGINRATKKSHGKTVRISRKKEEITEGTKFQKRKKGQVLQTFVIPRGGVGMLTTTTATRRNYQDPGCFFGPRSEPSGAITTKYIKSVVDDDTTEKGTSEKATSEKATLDIDEQEEDPIKVR
jgi:hypothetical protein